MKSSGIVLVPFTIWFILNFISIYDNDYQEIVDQEDILNKEFDPLFA